MSGAGWARGQARVAEDSDFQCLKDLLSTTDGWNLEYEKDGVKVWVEDAAHGALRTVKVVAEFDDVEADALYDVLHDPEYRSVWDTHMLRAEDAGHINVNNDVGYYAMSCPAPLKNRDFVLQRSWLDIGDEKMILNHSVYHKDYPPRKGFVRYLELEKTQKLLSPEDLKYQIESILDKFHGICLPGDKEGLDNVKMDISMQNERLVMLEKQDSLLEDLISKNEQVKENVTVELTYLNAALQQCSEDEATTAGECEKLAEEVENMTDNIMDVISDALDQYTNTQTDTEISKKFFTFGPFELYRQSQAFFRSHFDLYTTKKFSKKQNYNISVEELQTVLAEARNLEERLTNAAYAYIESRAELSGEQAKLALVANYANVHPSQITIARMEAQSALELLEQEEGITTLQLQSTIKQLVDSRTKMAVDTTVKAAMTVREQVHQELVYLHDVCLQALCVDRALYSALRYELRTIEELLQFAAQLWGYTTDERTAVSKRIELMNEICSEQEYCEEKLRCSDNLLQVLCKMLNIPVTNDAALVIKMYNELRSNLKRLNDEIHDEYKNCGNHLFVLVTRSPYSIVSAPASGPLLSSLTHSLTVAIKNTDKHILHATDTFTSIKKGDKQNLRKLWQWFLTDEQRLIAAVKGVSPKSY